MKKLLVFLLLFILTMGLVVGIDYFQGASTQDIISNILVSKTELVGEDFVILFFFTVPFGVASTVLKYLNSKKKKRNQEQNSGQNTTN